MFKSVGKLKRYRHWILINVDEEIGRYYRHLYKKSRWDVEYICPPTTAHITVASIHDIQRSKRENWYEYPDSGELIEFEYSSEATDGGLYVLLPVKCFRAQEIRNELNLGEPFYPFHITIGNRKYGTKYL